RAWMRAGEPQPPPAEDPWPELLAAHRRPQPRVTAGRILAAIPATAMMDLSDGLAGDAARIAAASKLAVVLQVDRIPVHAAAITAEREGWIQALDCALHGGEDFELLACLRMQDAPAAAKKMATAGLALVQVGYCVEGSGVWIEDGGFRRPL